MKESAPTNFYRPNKREHIARIALPTIVKQLVDNFSRTLSPKGILDYEGPTPLRYMHMSTASLVELRNRVEELGIQARRIIESKEFVLSESVRHTLEEIAKTSEEIIDSKEAKDHIASWEASGHDIEVKVEDGLATNLANQMHHLWENVRKLKESPISTGISKEYKRAA